SHTPSMSAWVVKSGLLGIPALAPKPPSHQMTNFPSTWRTDAWRDSPPYSAWGERTYRVTFINIFKPGESGSCERPLARHSLHHMLPVSLPSRRARKRFVVRTNLDEG